ncbi:uncharacterized protein TRUGW13939_05825 [Talaromyces rugulosus]|uniref:DUF967 domain protein n=1 Tax=Talaromyces rugulosus TaxID=121627 RepID=A0A7H8QYD9_TALRU|nr:uncharacterized protein TRUGW13939_05825 [Talaromyces rugulosus]QKX58698.1 hypothetical protein TRUGW13939_05825 [Talaromyces rugulosus]
MASSQPLQDPSTNPTELASYELSPSAVLPSFTASTAWSLGTALRTRILSLPSSQRKPAVISITQANGNHILFQAVTESGTLPDNEEWVRRKRNAVLRWGLSSWGLRNKIAATVAAPEYDVEPAFAKKFALKSSNGSPEDYAIHGGGFPIRVKGVDGIVGVIVVSGLKQEHDHQVIVEVIKDFIDNGGN